MGALVYSKTLPGVCKECIIYNQKCTPWYFDNEAHGYWLDKNCSILNKETKGKSKMKKTVYYISYSGVLLTMRDIETAFTVMTGKRKERDEGKYIKFLNMLFKKKKIIRYITPSVKDLIKMGKRTYAIYQYHKEHKECSFIEAKKIIDTIAGIYDTRVGHGDEMPIKPASMLAEIPREEENE